MATIAYDKVQDYLATLVPPREPELQEMESMLKSITFPSSVPRADIIVTNSRACSMQSRFLNWVQGMAIPQRGLRKR